MQFICTVFTRILLHNSKSTQILKRYSD